MIATPPETPMMLETDFLVAENGNGILGISVELDFCFGYC
jgi:hypothetical protein